MTPRMIMLLATGASILIACFYFLRPAHTDSEPTLEFSSFDEMFGDPYAILKLRNSGPAPIYFASYGPSYPLQTWERFDDGQWTQCGYDWCGSGRSIENLAGESTLVLKVSLREYRTSSMPDNPSLSDYRQKMRLVLYYGDSPNDIEHAIHSDAFSGAQEGNQ